MSHTFKMPPNTQLHSAIVKQEPLSYNSTIEHEENISILAVLTLFARRKRTIVASVALFAVLGMFLAFLLPNEYTATAIILPPQQTSSLGSVLQSQLGSLGALAGLLGGGLGLKNPNDLYVGMLTSRTVQDAMVSRFSLMSEYHLRYESEARKKLQDKTDVDGSNKDGLIHISVTDKNPARAAQLANGYVDQFRVLSEHLAITEASQRRLFFEQELEQAKDNLADSEEALKRTEQSTGLIELNSQTSALIQSALSLRDQIIAREVQLERLKTFATAENSQYIQAQNELAGLREQLGKLEQADSSPNSSLILPKNQIPKAGLDYLRRVRDVRYSEAIFNTLARQFEIAKLDEAKEGALIQVVDYALPPEKKSAPQRSVIILACAVAGFLVGILLVVLKTGLANMEGVPELASKLEKLRRHFPSPTRARRA